MKACVDKQDPEKSVKQIKAKLEWLKDAYKHAKDNNVKTVKDCILPATFPIL